MDFIQLSNERDRRTNKQTNRHKRFIVLDIGNFLGLLYPCSVGWRHLSEGQWLHEWHKPAHDAENHVEGGDGHQQELEGRIPEDAN